MTLQQAKKQLEIAPSISTHDDQLIELIQAGRESAEADNSQIAATGSFVVDLFGFPIGRLQLPYRNTTAITAITYYDTEDQQQTLDSAEYELVLSTLFPYVIPTDQWPDTSSEVALSVQVTFEAGWASQADVPQAFIQQVLAFISNLWMDRGVEVDGSGLGRVYEALTARQFATYP